MTFDYGQQKPSISCRPMNYKTWTPTNRQQQQPCLLHVCLLSHRTECCMGPCHQVHTAETLIQSQHNPCDLWYISGTDSDFFLITSGVSFASNHSTNTTVLTDTHPPHSCHYHKTFTGHNIMASFVDLQYAVC